MDAQTIAIIAVGVALLAAIVPLLVVLIIQVAETNRVVTALANHRHGEDGAPTFILPAD